MHPMTPVEAGWFAVYTILRAHQVRTCTAAREATRLVLHVEPNPYESPPVEFATPAADAAVERMEAVF